ncbi:hypothetical protein GCM10017688_30430 [Streptomyces ramulosus]
MDVETRVVLADDFLAALVAALREPVPVVLIAGDSIQRSHHDRVPLVPERVLHPAAKLRPVIQVDRARDAYVFDLTGHGAAALRYRLVQLSLLPRKGRAALGVAADTPNLEDAHARQEPRMGYTSTFRHLRPGHQLG